MKNFIFAKSWNDNFENDPRTQTLRVRAAKQVISLAAINYAAFGIIDIWAIPSAFLLVWFIRAVILILSLFIIPLTETKFFLRHYMTIILTCVLVWGGGILSMVYLAKPGEQAKTLYPFGLVLVLMGGYIWTILPVIQQAIGCTLLIVAYFVIGLLTLDSGDTDSLLVLLLNCFFLTGINILALLGSAQRNYYLIDNFKLREELLSDLLHTQIEKEQNRYSSEHDPLTGLLNRMGFLKQLESSISQAGENEQIALLFIDLDGFKQINDRLGHRAGDEVLKLVALRANACCREYDILGRLGGDEFVLVANIGVNAVRAAGRIATSLIASINQPMGEIEPDLRISASIGIAIYPLDGSLTDTLLSTADTQMYRAKRDKLGWASVRGENSHSLGPVHTN